MGAKRGGMTAKELIENAKARHAYDGPPEAALKELDALMEHNKGMTHRAHGRVTAKDAIALLASHGWACSRTRFDALLERRYGRRWLR